MLCTSAKDLGATIKVEELVSSSCKWERNFENVGATTFSMITDADELSTGSKKSGGKGQTGGHRHAFAGTFNVLTLLFIESNSTLSDSVFKSSDTVCNDSLELHILLSP
mmetsp:Transcript_17182/g.24874  ORF Transcript_17182/g.24874 Transcript_17182/m.24874 type:complete len:109 (-) Transcript_17182:133-459(-)